MKISRTKIQIKRIIITNVAAVFAFTGIIALVPGSVLAAPSPEARGAAACGSGYTLTHNTRLRDQWGNPGAAMFQVFVNKQSKKMCVVVMSLNDAYGMGKYMSLSINIENNDTYNIERRFQPDSGMFKEYAGPIYFSYPQYSKTYVENGYVQSEYSMNASARIDYHSKYNENGRKGGTGAYLPERLSIPFSLLKS